MERVKKGISKQQRFMDELPCFYAEAAMAINIHPWALQQGVPDDCDHCSIALQAKDNGSPYAHVYASRAWVACPVDVKHGGREVEGFAGHWGMFQFDHRTATNKLVDAVDAAIVNDVPVQIVLTPMRPGQRSSGKAALAARQKAPGYVKKTHKKSGRYARPATTRDYRGRSNQ